MTVYEVAKELRCCRRTVARLVASGRLPTVKLSIGGSSRLLVRRTSFEKFVDECASDYVAPRKLKRA